MHLLILACLFLRVIQGNPTGCTYDATNVLYTCDGRGWVLPLAFAAFTNQPQRLLLKDVAGELPASAPNGPTFTGFSSINTALFDPRFAPSFHVKCYANGYLLIFKDTFQDFGWIEEVKIQDCDILSLPTQVFLHFGTVNSFIIQGGSIDNMVADSFNGLDVKKVTSAITPKGEFMIQNCKIIGGTLPFGALFSMANVKHIMIDGAHLSSLSGDTFNSNPKLTNLSLSYNNFSDIPSGLFASSYSLQYVAIWGSSWQCTCSNLWFIPYVINNNITLEGDIVCTGKRAVSYYYANCITYDVCVGTVGFDIGGKCFTVIDILIYLFTVLSVLITFIAFALVMQLYCLLKQAKEKEERERNKATSEKWIKIDVMVKNVRKAKTVQTSRPYKEVEDEKIEEEDTNKKTADKWIKYDNMVTEARTPKTIQTNRTYKDIKNEETAKEVKSKKTAEKWMKLKDMVTEARTPKTIQINSTYKDVKNEETAEEVKSKKTADKWMKLKDMVTKARTPKTIQTNRTYKDVKNEETAEEVQSKKTADKWMKLKDMVTKARKAKIVQTNRTYKEVKNERTAEEIKRIKTAEKWIKLKDMVTKARKAKVVQTSRTYKELNDEIIQEEVKWNKQTADDIKNINQES